MADSKRYNDWYTKAKEDLRGANILFEHDGIGSMVAFHCQQSIEKALKGYILKNTNELVEGHSLVYLCKKASSINVNIKSYLKDCAFVNQFYVETRYPADIPTELEEEDVKECIAIAQALLNDIIESEKNV